MTAPVGSGLCRICGEHTDHGRVIINAEKVSGAGLLVLVCPACDLTAGPVPVPRAETAYSCCHDCGRDVANGIVLGDVSQDSGAGFMPVLCAACVTERRRLAAARDEWLRQTAKPGRGAGGPGG